MVGAALLGTGCSGGDGLPEVAAVVESREIPSAETEQIVEAYLHAHYFLEMAVRYGKTLKEPPIQLPSGWAALLYLYRLR